MLNFHIVAIIVLFTSTAAAIVADNWPGFAINYVHICLIDNCSIIQLLNC